jgi:predicted cupin superfamily sugar epimerase
MRLRGKSFVISKDSAEHFNQIKGRKVWVFFAPDSQLRRVNVEGNGENIYYVMDEKKVTTGMNRVECSRMNLFFEDNKVKKITFITKPEAKFIPPKEWTDELQYLDGFKWRDKEKVTLPYLLERVKYTNTVKKP